VVKEEILRKNNGGRKSGAIKILLDPKTTANWEGGRKGRIERGRGQHLLRGIKGWGANQDQAKREDSTLNKKFPPDDKKDRHKEATI